jgi:hypothetical protein
VIKRLPGVKVKTLNHRGEETYPGRLRSPRPFRR